MCSHVHMVDVCVCVRLPQRLKSKGKGGKAGSREGGSAEPVSVMEEDDSEDGDSDGKKEAEDDHEVEGSQEELSGEEVRRCTL